LPGPGSLVPQVGVHPLVGVVNPGALPVSVAVGSCPSIVVSATSTIASIASISFSIRRWLGINII
jgi:hypothetical protein